jgi:hypothetical protein
MLISVLAIGNPEYKNDSIDVLKDYFERNSLRYNFIENTPQIEVKGSHPSWWKLICHRIYKNEDYILNWDLDLLPTNKNTKFHEFTNLNKIAMSWDVQARYFPNDRFNNNFRYNGGLIGIPKSLSQFTENVFDTFAPGTRPSYEQYYLNDEIVKNNIDILEFPDDANFLYRDNTPELLQKFYNARFKHYSCRNREKLISAHRENYFR